MRPSTFIACLALLAATLPAVAAEQLEIDEWLVPWEATRPRDPFAATADSVWFVGQRAGYLGHLDAATGNFRKIDLKDGSGPHNLIVSSDGIIWYAGNRTALIGRYDPEVGAVEEILMPDPAAKDPHTLIFDADEENIFFTVQGGNMIGRLAIASRKVDLVASPVERSRPYGIKLAPNGTVWVALFGTGKLAQIEPDSLELTIVDLPRPETRPRRLVITSDGRVWYGDYAAGRLGVYDPAENDFREWPLPQGEEARPYGMAVDSQDRVWVVATGVQPNQFTGFDPETETFFSETPVPSGGGTVRHMHYHEPSGSIWFGTDTNYIGRAVVETDR
jgi:virginiamycin B lyase